MFLVAGLLGRFGCSCDRAGGGQAGFGGPARDAGQTRFPSGRSRSPTVAAGCLAGGVGVLIIGDGHGGHVRGGGHSSETGDQDQKLESGLEVRVLLGWGHLSESLEHPAARKPAPRSRRTTPENPKKTPQDPRRPRSRAALTRNRHDHEPCARHHQPGQPPQPGQSMPRHRTNQETRPRHGTENPSTRPPSRRAGMPEANVKMVPTET